MKVIDDFISNTSLHGWSFFGAHNGSAVQKVFWFLVLVASFSFSANLIKDSTETFLNTQTIISLEDR